MNEHWRILKDGFMKMWQEYRLLQAGEKKLYGWYSREAAKRHNRFEYRKPDGTTVICTSIDSRTEENRGICGSMWGDEQYAGQVISYVRTLPPLEPQFGQPFLADDKWVNFE